MVEVSFLMGFSCRLRTASAEAGLGQEPDFARVDRSATVGTDRAADCWRHVGFFEAEMGKEEAVYASLLHLGRLILARACVGGGDCGGVFE